MHRSLLPVWRERYPHTQFALRCVRIPLAPSGAFNMGAARNLGAKIVAEGSSFDRDALIFVFCDADKLPARADDAVWNFPETPRGCVRQYYGSPSLPGAATTGFGIFAVHASDFFRIGGFPNFWSWGMEDAEFTRRAAAHGLIIDGATSRVPVGDPRVLHLFRGPETHWLRVLSRVELFRFATGSAHFDGVECLRNVRIGGGDDENGDGELIVVHAFTAGTEDSPSAFVLPHHRIDLVPLGRLLAGAATLPTQGYRVPVNASAAPSSSTSSSMARGVPRNRLQRLFSGIGSGGR